MIFTIQELSAILRTATLMVSTNSNITEKEKVLMKNELMRFGVDNETTKTIVNKATSLDSVESCIIISRMTNEKKKYVTAYLGTMICRNGNIKESALDTWVVITSMSGLPTMSLQEAHEIMSKSRPPRL